MSWKMKRVFVPGLSFLAFALIAVASFGLADAGSSPAPISPLLSNSSRSNESSLDVGASEVDYFGMEVGNRFEAQMVEKKTTSQLFSEVIELDATSFDEPTYVVVETLNGSEYERLWYQKTPDGLAIRRIQAPDGILDLSEPLLFLKYPVVENDQWTSQTTGFFSGIAVSVKTQLKTYGKSLITTPAGTFLAYKISSRLELATSSKKAVMRGTEWFSPYIGDVRSNASGGGTNIKSELKGFLVGEGIIDTPPPIITGIDPSSGTYGQKIAISGHYFGESRGTTALTIEGVEVTDILSWSDNRIECFIPSNANSGSVVVSMDSWKSNEDIILHLTVPPEISGVSPSTGIAGTLITINGHNFGVKGKVTIGGVKAKVQKGGWNESSILCTVPKKLKNGTYSITVETAYGSDTLSDTYSIAGE